MEERLCFIGHTHDLGIIDYDGKEIEYWRLDKGLLQLDTDRRYIINCGSVGQPRDGNNNAKYVIWDADDDTIEVRFIPYDVHSVVKKIREAGLPEANALRLL
jgi:diadenosine tetraphosphatase ApaH/serine/threonine PP2A family protein phosphatase